MSLRHWLLVIFSAVALTLGVGCETEETPPEEPPKKSKTAIPPGAVSVSPGVWLYQVSGDSLALELTAKGTKYYKDSALN